jgi:hypothetical protein
LILDDVPDDLAANLLPNHKAWLDALLQNKAKLTNQLGALRQINKNKNDMVYRLKQRIARQPKASMKCSYGVPPAIRAAMKHLPGLANTVRGLPIQPNFSIGSSGRPSKKTNGTRICRSSRSNSPSPVVQDEQIPDEYAVILKEVPFAMDWANKLIADKKQLSTYLDMVTKILGTKPFRGRSPQNETAGNDRSKSPDDSYYQEYLEEYRRMMKPPAV